MTMMRLFEIRVVRQLPYFAAREMAKRSWCSPTRCSASDSVRLSSSSFDSWVSLSAAATRWRARGRVQVLQLSFLRHRPAEGDDVTSSQNPTGGARCLVSSWLLSTCPAIACRPMRRRRSPRKRSSYLGGAGQGSLSRGSARRWSVKSTIPDPGSSPRDMSSIVHIRLSSPQMQQNPCRARRIRHRALALRRGLLRLSHPVAR